MDLHFLGGATTVTGSQYLLETGRARVLIDCGMFQGSPNEAMRNRVPFAYDPSTIDVVLLTHAHLDHCGLIPHLVNEGYTGRILATRGTCELAELVLLDSGKLQEEFAKREARWERKHPDRAAADDAKEEAAYQEALDVAAGKIPAPPPHETVDDAPPQPATPTPPASVAATAAATATPGTAATTTPQLPTFRGGGDPDVDVEADLRAQPPSVVVDLDAPLYTGKDAEAAVTHFDAVEYGTEREVAPGVHATWLDAGHILGSAIIRVRIDAAGPDRAGPDHETTIVFSGDLGRRTPRSSATRRSRRTPTTSSANPRTAAGSTSPRTRRSGSSRRRFSSCMTPVASC